MSFWNGKRANYRLVHSLQPGEKLGLRGPVTTFSVTPSDWDSIIMVG